MDLREDQERAVQLGIPQPNFDNPLPIVLAKADTVVLSYLSWVGRKNAPVVLTFHVAFGHRLGPPDRKGVAAHPLAARGLKPDGAYEILNSSWIKESYGGKGRHYAFAFRDALFECAAEGYGSETIDEDDDSVRVMSRRLYR
jgi:hypothetical protein